MFLCFHNNPKTCICLPLHQVYFTFNLSPWHMWCIQKLECVQCMVSICYNYTCWGALIMNICCIHHHFCPKFKIEVLGMQYGPFHFHNGSICTFNHPILLRNVRGWCLFCNVVFFQEFTKLFKHMYSLPLSHCKTLILCYNALSSLNFFKHILWF